MGLTTLGCPFFQKWNYKKIVIIRMYSVQGALKQAQMCTSFSYHSHSIFPY